MPPIKPTCMPISPDLGFASVAGGLPFPPELLGGTLVWPGFHVPALATDTFAPWLGRKTQHNSAWRSTEGGRDGRLDELRARCRQLWALGQSGNDPELGAACRAGGLCFDLARRSRGVPRQLQIQIPLW